MMVLLKHRVASAMLLITALVACSDELSLNRTQVDKMLWSLSHDIKAATIAVGDTLKVSATPRNYKGDILEGRPVFRSSDSRKAVVDSITGVVTAVEASGSILIISSITIDDLTTGDTTTLAITATRNYLKSFSLMKLSPDTVAMSTTMPVMAMATDSNNFPVSGLPLSVQTNDKTIGTQLYGSPIIQTLRPGKLLVIGSTLHHGILHADTLAFTVVYPVTGTITLVNNAPDGAIGVGVGAVITWRNNTAADTEIEFLNDVENIQGGNITNLLVSASQSRKFLAPGVYRWKSSTGPQKGVITVLENP